MPDRLSIINDALVNTSNNRVQAEFEDSDEWDVGKTGYDRFLPILLEEHAWPFATTTEALVKLPDEDNPSAKFSPALGGFAYSMPGAALWLATVTRNGEGIEYEIIDDKICCAFDNAAVALVAKFTRVPPVDRMSNLFWEVLRCLVESALLRGMNEDYAAADRREAYAWEMLSNARSRGDQQMPRRSHLRSRALARRRGYRPHAE